MVEKTEAEYLELTKKALDGRRNRSQGVPPLVPVVTECEGSRKGAGLEVGFRPNGFSEKEKILGNTKLLTCPGIVGASDQLYYRPGPLGRAGVENRVQRGPPRQEL